MLQRHPDLPQSLGRGLLDWTGRGESVTASPEPKLTAHIARLTQKPMISNVSIQSSIVEINLVKAKSARRGRHHAKRLSLHLFIGQTSSKMLAFEMLFKATYSIAVMCARPQPTHPRLFMLFKMSGLTKPVRKRREKHTDQRSSSQLAAPKR